MIHIERISTPGLAQVAYIVAAEEAGVCAVIDPRRDVQVYIDWAANNRVRIESVLETHIHADFVSGGNDLAKATGATLYTPELGNAEYAHTPVRDGDRIAVGGAFLRAWHTPGHTPEHMAFILEEGEGEPTALFSGDVLFAGDVGRPDLLGTDVTAGLASQLFGTVNEKLKSLPDSVVVYPGHTAGSSCGKSIGTEPTTTIGLERRTNYAFQHQNESDFVGAVLRDMPTPPRYYPVLKRLNREGVPAFAEDVELPRLDAERAQSLIRDGARVFDMRPVASFAAGHVRGARFVGTDGNFQAWIGWFAPYDSDLILHVEPDTDTDEIRRALAQIGLDRIAGVYEGDPGEIGPVATVALINDRHATARYLQGHTLLDVRTRVEVRESVLERAINLPAGELLSGEQVDGVSTGQPIMTMCAGGYRSMVAASELLARGFDQVASVATGFSGALAERAQQEATA